MFQISYTPCRWVLLTIWSSFMLVERSGENGWNFYTSMSDSWSAATRLWPCALVRSPSAGPTCKQAGCPVPEPGSSLVCDSPAGAVWMGERLDRVESSVDHISCSPLSLGLPHALAHSVEPQCQLCPVRMTFSHKSQWINVAMDLFGWIPMEKSTSMKLWNSG